MELKSFTINDRARDCSRNDYRNEFVISYNMQMRYSVSKHGRRWAKKNCVVKRSSIFNEKIQSLKKDKR